MNEVCCLLDQNMILELEEVRGFLEVLITLGDEELGVRCETYVDLLCGN